MPSCAMCGRSFKLQERNGLDDRRGDSNGRRRRNAGAINNRRRCVEFMGVGRRRGSQPTRRHYAAGCIHDRKVRPSKVATFPNHPVFPTYSEPKGMRFGAADRRRPDHERREFEPRRQKVNWSSWRRRLSDCVIISYEEAERRKAQNSNQTRRQGPADRRTFEKRERLVYFSTPIVPKHENRRVVTVGGPNWGKTAANEAYPPPPPSAEPNDRVPGASARRRSSPHLGRRNAERGGRRKR